jgi:exopolysaccharide production protein ExoY
MTKNVGQSSFYPLIKRFIDLVLTIIFLFVTFPVIFVIAFLVWLNDRHFPFYSQVRIGKDGIPFNFYKIRSMVWNADEILFKNKELYEQIRSGNNKIKNDPRITKVGKFIRKYSIDEFPQVLNVIKGEMSFVGPRALRPDEYKLYEDKSPKNKEKLEVMTSVLPGISGYWQVSGRSEIDFDQRMDLECYYARNRSLLLDLKIIFKTPYAMLVGKTGE